MQFYSAVSSAVCVLVTTVFIRQKHHKMGAPPQYIILSYVDCRFCVQAAKSASDCAFSSCSPGVYSSPEHFVVSKHRSMCFRETQCLFVGFLRSLNSMLTTYARSGRFESTRQRRWPIADENGQLCGLSDGYSAFLAYNCTTDNYGVRVPWSCSIRKNSMTAWARKTYERCMLRLSWVLLQVHPIIRLAHVFESVLCAEVLQDSLIDFCASVCDCKVFYGNSHDYQCVVVSLKQTFRSATA